jgi:hypothetical protein
MTDKLSANHNLPCKQKSAPVPDQWFEMARRASLFDEMLVGLMTANKLLNELYMISDEMDCKTHFHKQIRDTITKAAGEA